MQNSNGEKLYGLYRPSTETLQINENYIKGFEVAQLDATIEATGLLLVFTTLQEFVHFGRDLNKLTSTVNGYEAGFTFESNISGDDQYRDINARNAH